MVCPILERHPEVDYGIRLSMSPAKIRAVLGKPTEDRRHGTRRTISYRAFIEDDDRVSLDYEATYHFEGGRLVAITLYDGE